MNRRKLKKIALRVLIFLGVVVGLPVLLQEGVYGAHYFVKLRPFQEEARAKIAPFLDDLKILSERTVFFPKQGGANALSFLNFRLD